MKERLFYLSKIYVLVAGLSALVMFLTPTVQVWAQEAVLLIQPVENQMVSGKKPLIECRIGVPWDMQSLYIELDGMDMTGLAEITDAGFSFKPAQALDPGNHMLSVVFMDDQGQEVFREFSFSSRHTELFETAVSRNNITGTYTNVIKKMDAAKDQGISDYTIEANLNTQNMVAEGPWMFSLESNVQFFDQELAASAPLEKGLEIADYLFTGQYKKGNLGIVTNIGDISVDESRNTISGLYRRGGRAQVDFGPVYAAGFVVRSDQVYGIDGDFGLDFDNSDHIYGFSTGIRLFSDRVNLKAIYASGGESASDTSYGVWPDPGGTDGQVHGFQVTTNLFEDRFSTFFEWDQSDYDSDLSDGTASVKDKAWLARATGQIGFFNYGAEYEYTGPSYMVPGNSSIQQDWEGFALTGGVAFERHGVEGHFSSHSDNVEDNPLSQTLESVEYGLAYTNQVFESLPVTLGWRQALQDSSDEPSGTDPTHTVCSEYTLGVSLLREKWSIGLESYYSQDDDLTVVNYDTSSKGVRLTPNYTGEWFMVTPYFSFDRTTDYSTSDRTDTLLTSLTIYVEPFTGFSIEGTGSYTRSYDDLDTTNQDAYAGDLKLKYGLNRPIGGMLSPSLLLQLIHNSSSDNVADTHTKETVIYFYLTAALDLSF